MKSHILKIPEIQDRVLFNVCYNFTFVLIEVPCKQVAKKTCILIYFNPVPTSSLEIFS